MPIRYQLWLIHLNGSLQFECFDGAGKTREAFSEQILVLEIRLCPHETDTVIKDTLILDPLVVICEVRKVLPAEIRPQSTSVLFCVKSDMCQRTASVIMVGQHWLLTRSYSCTWVYWLICV